MIADRHADDSDALPIGPEDHDRTAKVTMEDDRVSGEDELIASWVDQLRTEYPNAAAILLKGSYARGDAGAFSDIDFDVLLDGAQFERFAMYLVEDPAGELRHISVAIEDFASWLKSEHGPVDWAFGLAVRVAAKLLWARTPEVSRLLQSDYREHPSAEPELEDFVEGIGKIENAIAACDDLAVRVAAQSVAKLAPGLLQLLNPAVFPGTPRQALDAALGFPVAPVGYREDMLRCLGLSDKHPRRTISRTPLTDWQRLFSSFFKGMPVTLAVVTPGIHSPGSEMERSGCISSG